MFSNVLFKIFLIVFLATPVKASEPAQAPPSAPFKPQPIVILDPGHGGSDGGTVVKGHKEKDICLSVALRLQKSLKRMGGPRVMFTRDFDVYRPLDERVALGADLSSAIFVSIHVNDSDNRHDQGIVVYSFGYAMKAPKAPHRPVPPLRAPSDEESLASAILASSISHSLRTQGFPVQGVVHSDYYVLKNPRHPSVLVEIGYLSNRKDYKRLTSSAYRQKLADGLAHSIMAYIAQQNRHPTTTSAMAK